MTKARDLSKLLSTSNGKIAGSNLDVSFENISDTGTEGTKVASGTTAQRGSTTGQWRYNSTTGFFEGRGASTFNSLEPTPTVSSVDVTEVDSQAGGNQTIVVTGTNFTSGGTISFRGSSANFNASTTTINSATQVTAVAPKASFLNAQEPYTVRFTATSGTFGDSGSGLINVDTSPTWQTASGQLASISDGATGTHATVSATDADGDAVVYSVQSGSIPAGTSLNTSSGVISGNPTDVSSATTSNFTLRATANTKTVDRAFSIITNPTFDGSSSAKAFRTMSDIAGLYTGHQTLWTTLNGNTSAFQVKVDCSTTGGSWILVSFNFGTGGINSNDCQDTMYGGSNGTNWQYDSGRLGKVLNLGLGQGNTNGNDIYGENISSGSNSMTTFGGVEVTGTPSQTSFVDINYYNHGTQSNFTSAQMTAMRAFITSMYTSIPHVAISVDASDGAGSYDYTTAYNSNTQSDSQGHSTILKNAGLDKFRPQVRKESDDEHWSANLWTHNTWSAVTTASGYRESLSTTGDPSSTGLGVGANGYLFPKQINYQASTGGGANFGTPHLDSWSNGAGGTGNKLNSKTYFLVK